MGLVPGSLSPRLLEAAARQGSKLPFAAAAEEVAFFWDVWVSEDTLRRLTEGAGAALTAIEDEAVARLEREFPAPPPGPAIQQVSVDGAMVHLVGGAWAEVKTAAIGTVVTRLGKEGDPETLTTAISYCSRLADVADFGRRFKLEVHCRGTQAAGTVVAVQDGAEWIQGLLDTYCRDAVRVLDFAHLVEHLATAARAAPTPAGRPCLDSPGLRAWLAVAAHTLKQRGPDEILAALSDLPVEAAADRATAARLRDETSAYLAARLPQAQYPPSGPRATLSAAAAWTAPASCWWKPGSRAAGCAGPPATSAPCSPCAPPGRLAAGPRPGPPSANACASRTRSAAKPAGSGATRHPLRPPVR